MDAEFAPFFAASLDLLCIAGVDGYFKRLNPAWTTLLGWSVDDMEGRPVLDFVHPDDRAATQTEISKLAGGAETILFENRYRHRDSSYRWLQWNARTVNGGQRIYAMARDVTRQRQLEREILEIADHETERLGRELHDGLCQNLAGIAALSAALSRKLEASSASAASAASAAEIAALLNETIGQARDLAHGLGPVGLDESGLGGALETLALNVQRLHRVRCSFEYERSLLGPHPEVAAHLFRITQEAVSNAVSHGQAERIDIRLSREDGHGLLCVQDDGVGVPADLRTSDGIGMHTMVYRARLIGGLLDVRRLRRGTVVTCTFPLRERVNADE